MCDTLCVRTRDAMLFAKNSDRHPDEAQVVEWHDAARRPAPELRTQYLTIADAGRVRVPRFAPDVAVGRRARRERARRRDRQREDLDRRPTRATCRPRCSAWTSCGSASNAPRSADEALDVHHDAARAATARAARASPTATSRTSRRSSSPTPPAASSSRRATARGPRARSARGAAISNRISLGTDWTQRVGRRRRRHRLRHVPVAAHADRGRRPPPRGDARRGRARGATTTAADLARDAAQPRPRSRRRRAAGRARRRLQRLHACACTAASRTRRRPRR